MYTIKLEQFEGPLDLLLRLIEEEKLDISNISLAKVADQYIGYLKDREGEFNPEQLADFLVVAAKLILIKSKMLLPSIELDEEEVDLEKQLKIYREYLEASKKLRKMILKKNFSFCKAGQAIAKGFYPPKKVNKNILAKAFKNILKEIEPLIKLPKETLKKIISLKEKIGQVRKLLSQKGETLFSDLIKDTFSKTEVIITLLAVLELAKQDSVVVEQGNLFEEIRVLKNV